MGLDLALAGLVLLAAIRGWLKGFALQAIRLGGVVGCVYLADPLRNLVKPYVASHLPSIRPDLVDRLLWWASAAVAFVLLVGVASLVVKLTRRNSLGESEPRRNDQVGGMLLGIVKGIVVAAFLTAALQKYAVGYLKNVAWIDQQAKSSLALVWNEKYKPVDKVWASPPVQHFVNHIQRMGLSSPADKTSSAEPSAVQTASNPAPRLELPNGFGGAISTDGLDPEVAEAVEAIKRELKALERPN